ncbi:pentatricopeptide repeat-containing protein At3g13880-like [Hibiscus syriacus]|uniref:pentatricopeptide repeat-containing protein At3g13880-like n=1 Tax=Hibiscus syriacus TaxID=106335 RepID=UPI0019243E0B|nr:pentatricopeptide repeat-containing protein At3g13880-like [Hibiscus syriacus]
MYSKAGEMDVPHLLFDKMSKPDLVSYNSLISGYYQMGAFDKAMQVLTQARKACLKLDKFTYDGALNVCAQTGDLKQGKLIHGLIEKAFLTYSLIDVYCKCECVDQAMFLFENSKEIDEISWNTLIAGYVRAIATMTNPLYILHELSKQVKDSNPKLVVTVPELLDKVKGFEFPVILLGPGRNQPPYEVKQYPKDTVFSQSSGFSGGCTRISCDFY